MIMNRTEIEWVKNPDGSPGYSWNPITGCLNGCPYCYARKLANGRLRQRYLANPNVSWTYEGDLAVFEVEGIYDPFYPRFWPERLLQPTKMKKASGIFTVDMGELFGDWIPHDWQDQIFNAIKLCPQHRFYLLTKQPQNLIKWSPFPENCWVGVTATDIFSYEHALTGLSHVEAKVKFLSIEPLLRHIDIRFFSCTPEFQIRGINWLIIGAVTGRRNALLQLAKQYLDLTLMPGRLWTLQPDREWVKEIVNAADKAHIPVFLKDNLEPLFPETFRDREYAAPPFFTPDWDYRQEMPMEDIH
jgi:protein gp37